MTYIIRSIKRPHNSNSLVIKSNGQLVYWINIYSHSQLLQLAESTKTNKIRQVLRFYEHADAQDKDLDLLLSGYDLDWLIKLSESFFVYLYNNPECSEQYTMKTWSTICHFVETTLYRIKPSLISRNLISIDEISIKLDHLKSLYRQLHRRYRSNKLPQRALSSDVVEIIFELIEPSSPQNPFRSSVQERNFLLVSFMLLLGLRTSECLLLTGKNIAFEDNRAWLKITTTNENIDDSRYSPPSLKTPYSHRIVPLPNYLYLILNEYLSKRGLNTKVGSSFIFLSNQGRPMSSRQVRYILSTVGSYIEKNSKGMLSKNFRASKLSPHDLRHTAACSLLAIFQSKNNDMTKSMNQLREFMGWSPNSDMPCRYARLYIQEQANSTASTALNIRLNNMYGGGK